MFELVCVTHRGLCAGDLPQRVGELCRGGIRRVILREKDLSEAEYEALARQVLAQAGDRVVLHHFPQVCARVGVPRLHLSLGQLEAQPALRETARPLMDKGLKIRLCRNALNDNNLTEADLWPGVEVVPAGLVEIVRLQQNGFAYIKP